MLKVNNMYCKICGDTIKECDEDPSNLCIDCYDERLKVDLSTNLDSLVESIKSISEYWRIYGQV
jgi:hypothetical protein